MSTCASTRPEPLLDGVAHRVTADAEPELSKETGFHPRTGS